MRTAVGVGVAQVGGRQLRQEVARFDWERQCWVGQQRVGQPGGPCYCMEPGADCYQVGRVAMWRKMGGVVQQAVRVYEMGRDAEWIKEELAKWEDCCRCAGCDPVGYREAYVAGVFSEAVVGRVRRQYDEAEAVASEVRTTTADSGSADGGGVIDLSPSRTPEALRTVVKSGVIINAAPSGPAYIPETLVGGAVGTVGDIPSIPPSPVVELQPKRDAHGGNGPVSGTTEMAQQMVAYRNRLRLAEERARSVRAFGVASANESRTNTTVGKEAGLVVAALDHAFGLVAVNGPGAVGKRAWAGTQEGRASAVPNPGLRALSGSFGQQTCGDSECGTVFGGTRQTPCPVCGNHRYDRV